MTTQEDAITRSAAPRMHVRQSGTAGQPTVVFLHGVGNSGGMWAQHMKSLAGYQCLAPDLPGFGRSNRLPWVSLIDTADQVAQLIESRATQQRTHIVGLSLGGAMAHTLLARQPELLDRVIIDGCGVLPWWGVDLIKAGVSALSPFLGTRLVIEVVARGWRLDQESRADLRAASPRAFRRGFADANSLQMTPGELTAPCPTLLVAGEKEVRPPVRASNAALAALMPHAEARYIPGKGHGWLGQAPQLHRTMVKTWLGGLPLPSDLLPETTSPDKAHMTHLLGGRHQTSHDRHPVGTVERPSEGNSMWMECFAGDMRIDGDDAETIADRFVAHASERHDWTYSEESLRNYARNYAEATVRITGSTERLFEIGNVTIHPVTEDRIDDWLEFFDHRAFAGNPGWASCYCLEPHLPATEESPEAPWREVRAAMVERLRDGGTFGYLAYVDGRPAGWVNASLRSEYGLYRQVDPDGPDPASVIGVSCFIIAPPYRRHGIAAMLLDRVVDDAVPRGAQWLEGYPRSTPEGDAGHFRGPRHLYESRGFEPVEQREHDTVMRRAVVTS